MSNGNGQNKQYMYGLVAAFEEEEDLVEAAKRARAAGYEKLRAFSPFRIKHLADVLETPPNVLPWLVVGALVVGAVCGYLLQYYTDVLSYPINVGGRPLNSWPAFMIISFELAILFGGLTTVGGLFILNGLPQPYHPIFNTPDFELASGERFYLCIEVTDQRFHLQRTREFLQSLDPHSVSEVPC